MISIMYSQSCLSTAALIFYICIWIPFHQLRKSLFHGLGFLLFPGSRNEQLCPETPSLPAARYEDLKDDETAAGGSEVEAACSICLAEFEREDVVSQLSNCGHVFHLNCIEKWLERDQFTCPLCRALMFSSLDSICGGKCGNIDTPALSHLDYSFLSF